MDFGMINFEAAEFICEQTVCEFSQSINLQLRRQRLILYISRSIETSASFSAPSASLTKHYEDLLTR